MSDARERLRRLLLVWQMSVPAILLMPRVMQGVLPYSPGMVNAGAHNTVGCRLYVGGYVVLFQVWQMLAHAYTVDAQRHVGGALPYGSKWHLQYYRGECRRLQHCLGFVELGRS